jgi:hypothetical protein
VSILLVVAAGQGMDTAVAGVVVANLQATEKENFRLVGMSAGVESRR